MKTGLGYVHYYRNGQGSVWDLKNNIFNGLVWDKGTYCPDPG